MAASRFAIVCATLSLASFGVGRSGGAEPGVVVDFLKVSQTRASLDTVVGTIYHRDDGVTFIHSRVPIAQWVWVSSQHITVYYPDKKRALRMPSVNPLTLPFFQTFVSISGAETGLGELGYRITGSGAVGDSLVTDWVAKTPLSASLLRAQTVHHDDQLISVAFYGKNDELLLEIWCTNYEKKGSREFPMIIEINRYGEDPTFERVEFSGLVFDGVLIDSVKTLRIPSDVTVENLGRE
ncbi:MAG: hypothetical protein V3V49_09145 [Candidatus Krumholzibacteria bacterium]